MSGRYYLNFTPFTTGALVGINNFCDLFGNLKITLFCEQTVEFNDKMADSFAKKTRKKFFTKDRPVKFGMFNLNCWVWLFRVGDLRKKHFICI
jgi:hypothetical protein